MTQHRSPAVGSRLASLSRRVALLAAGSAIAAYGYLLTAVARVGNGPLFAVQDGFHVTFGWSLALAAVVVGLAMVAIAIVLRAPLGPATVALPIANGAWVWLLERHVSTPSAAVWRWVQFGGGTVVMMLGVVIAVSAAWGMSAIDGTMIGLARVLRTTPARARLGMELSFTLGGAALGGRVGLGTIAMGASVGYLFTAWSAVLERLGLSVSMTQDSGLAKGRNRLAEFPSEGVGYTE